MYVLRYAALVVLFFPHLLQAVREPALLTLNDSLDGVVITITSSSSSGSTSLHLTLPDQQLSQECGHNFIRCQHLFVETVVTDDDLQTMVLFIPLVRGIALVGVSQETSGEYSINKYGILQTFDDSAAATSCSPSVFFRILDGYFAVCTNKTTNFIAVFAVQLNTSSLSSSGLLLTNQLTIPSAYGNLATASNFLHVEIDRSHEYIIFAVGTVILSIRPFLYFVGPLGEGIPRETCDLVHTLVPIQGAQFYAYCSDHVFTYDVGEQDWTMQEAIAGLQGRGVVYPCPRHDTDISVFSDHIQIRRDDSSKNVAIEGDSYGSAVCMGNSSHSYFAYLDRDAGLYVYALGTVGLEEVAPVARLPHQCGDTCYPLVAVDGQYLIVRDSMMVSVLGVPSVHQGNLSVLIEATFTTTPLVTVLVLGPPPTPPTPPTPPLTVPSTGTGKPTNHTGTGQVSTAPGGSVVPKKDVSHRRQVVGGVAGSVLSVLVVVHFTIAVIAFLCYKFRPKGMQTSSPETGKKLPQQQVTGLQATTTGEETVDPQQPSRDLDPQQASRDLDPQQASRDVDPQQASRDLDPQQISSAGNKESSANSNTFEMTQRIPGTVVMETVEDRDLSSSSDNSIGTTCDEQDKLLPP